MGEALAEVKVQALRAQFLCSLYQVGGARRGAGAGHDVDLLISHPTDRAYFDSMMMAGHRALSSSVGGAGGGGMDSMRPTMGAGQGPLSQVEGSDDEDLSGLVGDNALQGSGQGPGPGRPLVHALFEDLVAAGR